jgi:diguanylate cyclase (GGDEF)-like protein
VNAYRLLYQLALDQGDTKSALAYHEKFAAADKGYLDDVSARQIAYERAKHETAANRLQIDALNKQNEVLQLQQQLGKKAVETSRLYIALLIVMAVFIALFAYRTKRSQLHFMKLSRVDGLTGIHNRPYFIAQAERALEASRKLEQEVCVILCDLDHFKSINDKFGHATGDHVLRQAVDACRNHLRASDLFGRFGGEEFCILLPGCSLADARQRCEQLRAAIATVTTDGGNPSSTVSASFGVAASSSSGYELRQLLAHADAALYRAKYAGRNCVVLYDTMHAVSIKLGQASA